MLYPYFISALAKSAERAYTGFIKTMPASRVKYSAVSCRRISYEYVFDLGIYLPVYFCCCSGPPEASQLDDLCVYCSHCVSGKGDGC